MSLVQNVSVYGINESIIASGYPMLTTPPTEEDFAKQVCELKENHTSRAKKLSSTPQGSGHDNFLKGCIAQFDLCFTVKAWTEAERYHFFDFVSSMSSMHRLSQMDLDMVFCDYVTVEIREIMRKLQSNYKENPSAENFLTLLYNCPVGLKLTARMTTNYLQLKTIYNQRKDHRLPEWREFCRWIETLPHSEFITGKKGEDI